MNASEIQNQIRQKENEKSKKEMDRYKYNDLISRLERIVERLNVITSSNLKDAEANLKRYYHKDGVAQDGNRFSNLQELIFEKRNYLTAVIMRTKNLQNSNETNIRNLDDEIQRLISQL